MKRQITLTTLALYILSSPAVSLAQSRSGGAGVVGTGGDPVIGREEDLKELIEGSLRNHLETFLRESRPSELKDTRLRAQFEAWRTAPDAVEDLRKSPYTTDGGCRDQNGLVPASTPMNKKLHGICFDPGMLAMRNTNTAEMVGVAIHEHAHHFGIVDEDHALQRYARDWWKKNGTSVEAEMASGPTSFSVAGAYQGTLSATSIGTSWHYATAMELTVLARTEKGMANVFGNFSGSSAYQGRRLKVNGYLSAEWDSDEDVVREVEITVTPDNYDCPLSYTGILIRSENGGALSGNMSRTVNKVPCQRPDYVRFAETLTFTLGLVKPAN